MTEPHLPRTGVVSGPDDPACALTSLHPLDPDRLRGGGQRQRSRLGTDGLALEARKTLPGLDREVRVGTAPGPNELTVEEDGTRPDARGPQQATTVGLGHQELTVRSPQEEVRIPAAMIARRPAQVGGEDRLRANPTDLPAREPRPVSPKLAADFEHVSGSPDHLAP